MDSFENFGKIHHLILELLLKKTKLVFRLLIVLNWFLNLKKKIKSVLELLYKN
jgi:hypothetical protein